MTEIIKQDGDRIAQLLEANNRLLIAIHEYEEANCTAERQAAIVDIQKARAAMMVLDGNNKT